MKLHRAYGLTRISEATHEHASSSLTERTARLRSDRTFAQLQRCGRGTVGHAWRREPPHPYARRVCGPGAPPAQCARCLADARGAAPGRGAVDRLQPDSVKRRTAEARAADP